MFFENGLIRLTWLCIIDSLILDGRFGIDNNLTNDEITESKNRLGLNTDSVEDNDDCDLTTCLMSMNLHNEQNLSGNIMLNSRFVNGEKMKGKEFLNSTDSVIVYRRKVILMTNSNLSVDTDLRIVICNFQAI